MIFVFEKENHSRIIQGNLHFKSLIEETHNAHFAMNERKDKFEMTVQIADQIINQELIVCGGGGSSGPPHHHQPKMRFLEWNKKNAWVLVNESKCDTAKLANSLTEFKRSCTGRYNNNTNTTATITNSNSNSNSNSNTAASPSLLSSLSSWSASNNNNNNNNNSNSNSNTNKRRRKAVPLILRNGKKRSLVWHRRWHKSLKRRNKCCRKHN